ncbi:MAG: glycoside-pentoside-hexuronide (GPH):cation symporter [Cellulomonadaceae bacterium]|jgi:melibiose permease/lactose/raffinose/galactose permease|nr:glycoside-pentoside-hexuronide (GPH):cation symporter [Cellulomonadaceae bacterium]
MSDSTRDFARNRWTFGIGTIGRDMLYTLVSMFLIVYLTNAAGLTNTELGVLTTIIVVLRVFDAINDPIVGMIVDNTRSRWGKHKPWILVGAVVSGLLTVGIFANSARGTAYVVSFTLVFFFWSIFYSFNDVAYWSYVPALSKNQKEREGIGSRARIFSLVGVFFVVAGYIPLIGMMGDGTISNHRGWVLFTILIVVIMWLGQSVTLLGVREPRGLAVENTHTTLREFSRALFKNDQLLIVAVAMILFMIGYTTTTSFGTFYFQHVYGDATMFSIFAVVLGVSQIVSLMLFPKVTKRLSRRNVYLWATVLVVVGYVLFFIAPTDTMIVIGVAGVLIFVGQAAIQLLMLLFLADTVDYGHWKLGKRNDSVTFSLQPLIYKAGGAIATGIVGWTAIITGLNNASDSLILNGQHLLIFKLAMFALPLVCILVGFLVYYAKFTITEETYATIHADLVARGEIASDPAAVKADQ